MTNHSPSQPSPEATRRIEENRLRAKALHAESLSIDASASSSGPGKATGIKRAHASISTTHLPETSRDARQMPPVEGIQVARKFRKYIDHDFSKMTDTKGGFLSAADDPWNKAMNHARCDATKPAHMTEQEWERHQVIRGLRNRKEGPFEPGIGLDARENGRKCRECGSLEIDWQWEATFGCAICAGCKENYPEKYSLLTKTEAKDDYLLTDPELKDAELLPHLSKPNPHKTHWHDMMLFLRYQVEEYAFNTKWGSSEALDAEFEKREADKKKRKEEKFKSKLRELKKKTRTEAFRRNNKNKSVDGQFGDQIGGQGKHEHEWGQVVEKENSLAVRKCILCHMEVEELVF
ncbi:BgTH12-07925 [Blumeria graminis f. sp. triticale]|uniref:DNA repair protein RAD14 n=1 Tax=Blumeria graminis f. sp. triticale TaxID=1689686 RepID=A0A9W4D0F6_BLUGR|nr:BgTH12-07925 [Blumeria graminis f. sp. triticale]